MPGDGLGGWKLEGGQGRRDRGGGVQPGRHRLIRGQQARYPVVQPAQHYQRKRLTKSVLRIRYTNFFHPGSASKNLSILTQKIVSNLLEIRSGLFIPDPDPDFFLPIPDPGVKKAPDPGS
jgi:hypothetical protein